RRFLRLRRRGFGRPWSPRGGPSRVGHTPEVARKPVDRRDLARVWVVAPGRALVSSAVRERERDHPRLAVRPRGVPGHGQVVVGDLYSPRAQVPRHRFAERRTRDTQALLLQSGALTVLDRDRPLVEDRAEEPLHPRRVHTGHPSDLLDVPAGAEQALHFTRRELRLGRGLLRLGLALL